MSLGKAVASVEQAHQISIHERAEGDVPDHNEPDGAWEAPARESILEAFSHSSEALPGKNTLQVLQLNTIARGLSKLGDDLILMNLQADAVEPHHDLVQQFSGPRKSDFKDANIVHVDVVCAVVDFNRSCLAHTKDHRLRAAIDQT